MFKNFKICLSALTLLSNFAFAANPPSTVTTLFLQKVHIINQAEVKVGQLASKRARSVDAKRFGEMLVTDHQAADKRVLAAADKDGVKLIAEFAPPVKELQAKLDKMYLKLEAAKAADFDKEFATEMVKGHEGAIELVNDVSNAADASDQVKALAKELLPSLQHHKKMAEDLLKLSH